MNSAAMSPGRRLLRWYKAFCIIAGALVLLYAAARIGLLRSSHRDEAQTGFQSVRAGTRNAMAAFDARDDAYFSASMREIARNAAGLDLLAVHEPETKVYYFFAKRTDIFPLPPAPTADMRRVPAYRSPRATTLALTTSFEYGTGARTITVEALYSVLTVEDLLTVAKEIVYLLLVFLIVTATVLLVYTSVSAPDRTRGRAAAAPSPAYRAHAATAATEPASMPRGADAGAFARAEAPPRASTPAPARAPGTAAGADPRARADAPPAAPREPLRQPALERTGAEAKAPAKSIYNPSTGLVFQELLPSRLRSELDRAAASDQDMVLAIIGLDRWEMLQHREAVHAAIAGKLREGFPYRDLAFEYGKGFAVIVPDINLDKALDLFEGLRARIAQAPLEGETVTISVGIAARNGRLLSEETFLKEASHSLAKAIRDGENQVVAFRADPDKFRRVLAP